MLLPACNGNASHTTLAQHKTYQQLNVRGGHIARNETECTSKSYLQKGNKCVTLSSCIE
jgi:hypothetical protein